VPELTRLLLFFLLLGWSFGSLIFTAWRFYIFLYILKACFYLLSFFASNDTTALHSFSSCFVSACFACLHCFNSAYATYHFVVPWFLLLLHFYFHFFLSSTRDPSNLFCVIIRHDVISGLIFANVSALECIFLPPSLRLHIL